MKNEYKISIIYISVKMNANKSPQKRMNANKYAFRFYRCK